MQDRKHLYTKKYPTTSKNIVEIGEIKVELPYQPPFKEMRNFGLPEKDQKFRRDTILPNYNKLAHDDPEKEAFVKTMFHLRENGEWWLIKGKPVYVCGHAWYFFNWWHLQEGSLPKFRMEAVEFFQVYEYAVRNPNILGLCIIKGRQEGCSSKLNCALYNDATIRQYQHIALMGDSEHRSKENYNKIGIGHLRMVKFFQPIHKGTTKQQKELNFTLPEQKISAKFMNEILEQMDVEGVESKINYAASTLGQYDGDRPNRFYFDECFKVDKFDPYDQLNIVKPGLETDGGETFSGKAFLASTVEEKGKDNFNEAVTIPYTQKLWDDSNPNDVNKFGRTKSGLIRLFRDFTCSRAVDEYGFVDMKRAEEWYNEEVKSFTDKKDWQGLANFKRRKPKSINDALQISSNECVLFPHLLEQRLTQIREGLNNIGKKEDVNNIPVRGNLIWTDSTRTAVRWVIDEKGKWFITQHPIEPNAKRLIGRTIAPKFKSIYKIGIDPTDSSDDAVSAKKQLSETAICVKRSFDEGIDNEDTGVQFYDHDGVRVCATPHAMKTNRYVCVYLHRNDDPYYNYDDALKTAIYYGTPALLEKNIRYVRNQFLQEGYGAYLTNPPQIAVSSANSKTFMAEKGITTTPQNKKTYTDTLINYFYSNWCIIDFEQILNQARNFNGKNHTDLDLIVAMALAEIQEESKENMPKYANKKTTTVPAFYRSYSKKIA